MPNTLSILLRGAAAQAILAWHARVLQQIAAVSQPLVPSMKMVLKNQLTHISGGEFAGEIKNSRTLGMNTVFSAGRGAVCAIADTCTATDGDVTVFLAC
ncbi:MAG: hypothetical protein JXX29_00625 [Deltaproteobacteria bacterium]|nr:hypothetical protein [Deltaproteobacteria bacterium]MBN2670141.1 hypothetical protein [Deltaproteobacteria bacterium]